MFRTDEIIAILKKEFSAVPDTRRGNIRYSLPNLLGLAYSMFHLKDASLSLYREQFDVRADNLARIYGVTQLPGDTALREGLDSVNPKHLQALFEPLIKLLRSLGILQQRKILDKYTLVSVDGTQHYCSGKQSCSHCLIKNHRNGKQTYHHQMLVAVAVHPQEVSVFPVSCEAIVNEDGYTKNDCELNASKRLLPHIRKTLGTEEPILAVFDALYNNGVHVKALQAQQINYIIATKGKSFVDIQINTLKQKQELATFKWYTQNTYCIAKFHNSLIINGQHQDINVNYFEVVEIDKKTGKQVFYSTWMTDLEISIDNIRQLVEAARARWKIENETFNTLKNQGYHFKHNYGHGKKYLATNFAILTLLAFLTDQIALTVDEDFKKAKLSCKSFKALWQKIRMIAYLIPTKSINAIYRFIIKRKQIDMPPME